MPRRDPVRISGNPRTGYRISYYDSGVVGIGARRQERAGHDAHEAQRRADEIRHHLVGGHGGPVPSADRTFGEVAELWIDGPGRHWPKSRLKAYRRDLNCYLLPVITAVPVADLSTRHLAAVLDRIVDRELSRATLDGAVRTLNALTTWATPRGHFPSDVFGSKEARREAARQARAALPDPNQPISLADVPTPEHIEAFADEMERRYAGRGRNLVMLLAGTGLRLGEALGLQDHDVDLDSGTVAVRRQADSLQPWPSVTTTKTATRRTAFVWASHLDFVRAAVANAEDGWLFPPDIDQFGTRGLWWRNRLSERLTAARCAAGWDERGWTTHSLRHAWASRSITPQPAGGFGLPVDLAARGLGHQDASTTLKWYVRSTGDDADLVRRLTRE